MAVAPAIAVRHFDDLGYSASAAVVENVSVDFCVYQIVGTSPDGTIRYYDTGILQSVEHADIYLSGEVKWDGCSNWTFDVQQRFPSMLHFCGAQEAAKIGHLFTALYAWADELFKRRDSRGDDGLMSVAEAFTLADLWGAGKMIGGDEQAVIAVLAREARRLQADLSCVCWGVHAHFSYIDSLGLSRPSDTPKGTKDR